MPAIEPEPLEAGQVISFRRWRKAIVARIISVGEDGVLFWCAGQKRHLTLDEFWERKPVRI